jgi:predicted dehydrogenase
MDRRTFLKRTTATGLGLGVIGRMPAWSGGAPSDTIVMGVMGVNGRGRVLAQTFAGSPNTEVAYICDVDQRATEKAIAAVSEPTGTSPAIQEKRPEGVGDFRRILDDESVDALVIAAPDHWHAPASILALQAGKHVYVEKPGSHNMREVELLVEAQRKANRIVQMGNQQRSAPRSIQIIQEIHDGIIGRPYFARAWYANTRKSIGRGKPADVPEWLDYELWQGPAPRTHYRDNVVHYNWHWFWRWGTGEINNNASHEIDISRWALQVDLPYRVTSAGGRYHFDDDWEAFDTQVASYEFDGGKTVTWEGRSCNGRYIEGRSRGTSIHGEKGTVVVDRSGYVVYDNANNEIKRDIYAKKESALDTLGAGRLTDLHAANFLDSIRGVDKPRSPIQDAYKGIMMCHLGNIAQRTGRALRIDPATGQIVDDAEAMKYWSRKYEPGWEPKV